MAAALRLTHRHLPGVTVIALAGELDTTNYEHLPAYLGRCLGDPADQVVFDLAKLTFLDSSGLRALLLCRRSSLEAGGELRLACLQPLPARLVEITGVGTHMATHETVDQAVAAATT
ncbi:anti-sigma B factor antagonist/stage II sporulation protein AA (anti-sigma F factor antagonist) [Nonomuraea solani]|uniref:Anti-sigma factor antagonist n=1 Tax=Nonomuraea solani TaxID=1144553 RepID=A0A1H6EG68_9ACTN|nr:STAS domain-containing protein [Nonomuraea solani]SEG96772.1 anti-sigma B factor antagonist/stage II sporulation protein AA (anti-sigma F factor antagonist) [Nonomuraea solani]